MDQEQNKFEKDMEQQNSDELPKEAEGTPALCDAPQKEEPAPAVTEEVCDPAPKEAVPQNQEGAVTKATPPAKEAHPAPVEQNLAEKEPAENKEKHKKAKKEKKAKKQ